MNARSGHRQKQGTSTLHLHAPKDEQRITDAEYFFSKSKSRYDFHVSLFNQQYIQIERNDKRGRKNRKVAFHVGILQAKPMDVTAPCWPYSYAAIATAIIASVVLIHTSQMLIGLMFVLLTGIFSFLLWRSYNKSTIFFSNWGDAAALVLPHKGSNSESLTKFTQKLSQYIAQNPLPPQPEYLAEEAKVLRNMHKNMLLSKKEYANAKTLIAETISLNNAQAC